ncbi:exopolyphosphatase [Arsenicicoccus dermatophilus]|uniref:Ppx/GppA phosphatase family protein n=1 Tax=Arsenicicoccus dermatophilus TaxID=1076331 RepID=UPI001F4CB891|nr:exopolyphosphatase [Arsenicicoccus dermatophilus]MCH8612134.1 exopolyphosphatase [Arsenicicoccus dermatophilus]
MTRADGIRRVGVVDCGTNSIRLLVADVDPARGTLVDVDRRMDVVRLGEGVDATGRIGEAAVARALGRSREYAERCRELDADAVRFVATSASRDARNAGDVVAGVRAAFAQVGYAVEPEVISGAEEASLSFRGATGDLVARGVPGPFLVVDIGGGSTELVRGDVVDGAARVSAARSVDVGCVRLRERHHLDQPPTPAQVAAALADVDAGLDLACAAVPLDGVRTLVGVAGTVTTLTAQALRLPAYDPDRIHLASTPAAVVLQACTELLAMPGEDLAALGFLHPGRVDVIGAGALIWRRVVERVAAAGADDLVITSERDILDGLALDLAGR